MANQYIKFRKYLFKNDTESALLLYDYFLEKPQLGNLFIKKFIRLLEIMARPFVRIFFDLRLGAILPKKESNSDFIISRQGHGLNATKVYLIKDQGSQLKIIKEYPNEKELEKELTFVNRYKNKSNKVIFPSFRKINSVTAEIGFLKSRNLAGKISSGSFSYQQLISIYNRITEILDELYQDENDNHCLINGDLGPANIYLIDDKLYFIDFSDSHIYEKQYDAFNLLKKLFYYQSGRDQSDLLLNYFCKEEIDKYDNHREKIKIQRHPGISRGKLKTL